MQAALREGQRAHEAELEDLKRRNEDERMADLTALRRDKEALTEGASQQIARLRDMLEHKNLELNEQCRKHMDDVEKMGEEIQFLKDVMGKRELAKDKLLHDQVLKHEQEIEARLKQELLHQDLEKRGY